MTDVHGTREPAALALVANLIGRYANHDEDCPKRVVVGRHYPQYETCSCGYQEDARAVFAALAVQNAARLAAPVERELPARACWNCSGYGVLVDGLGENDAIVWVPPYPCPVCQRSGLTPTDFDGRVKIACFKCGKPADAKFCSGACEIAFKAGAASLPATRPTVSHADLSVEEHDAAKSNGQGATTSHSHEQGAQADDARVPEMQATGELQASSTRPVDDDSCVPLLQTRVVAPAMRPTPQEPLLVVYARAILTQFQTDEAAGYLSRDRQYAIALLTKGLAASLLEPSGTLAVALTRDVWRKAVDAANYPGGAPDEAVDRGLAVLLAALRGK